MMGLLIHFSQATIATTCFAYIFNAPYRCLLSAGFSGGIGWLTFVFLRDYIFMSNITANFLAAAAIGILAEIFARLQKEPVTMFVVPGIIVLVPGYSIFRAMNMFIHDAVPEGLNILLKASTESGAIAVGILFVGILVRFLKTRPFHR